jgi:prostaglandin-endoperoxide synthase 2/linoleate 10R-lipoxygenase
MERVIQLTSRLPPTSKLRTKLTVTQVDQLWDSLQHPPLSYLGNRFSYRQPDGSCNNVMHPEMGRAGSEYARSVKPLTKLPGALPDAYTLFDSIFSRGPNDEHYRKHNNNVSSMLFYTASIIIHGKSLASRLASILN